MAPEKYMQALIAAGEVHFWASAVLREMDAYEALFSEEQARRGTDGIDQPLSVEGRELAMRRAAVGHWIFIGGNQLRRALQSDLPRNVRNHAPASALMDALALLRHFAEHPESSPRSDDQLKRLQRKFPTMAPGSMHWNREQGVTLGGTVRLSEVRDAIRPLLQAAKAVDDEFRRRLEDDGRVDPESICAEFGGVR